MKRKILVLEIVATLILMLFTLTGCVNNEQTTQQENHDNSNVQADEQENNNNSNTQVDKRTQGNLSKIITAQNYGDKINYSANGIDDWKIFYNDGENIFIITSALIPNSKVPDSIGIESRRSQYLNNYNVIWDSDSTELTKYVGTSSIDKNIAKKYQLEWIERHSGDTENLNMKVIASLFDENNWSSFINSNYAESAIGSPTLEMFIKSWNAKYPNNKLYYSDGEYGYYIGKEENPTTNGVYGLEDLKQDKLYNIVPEKSTDDGAGFTLSSPGAKGQDRVCSIGKSSVSFRDPFSSYDGVRPIVCLKSNVNAKYEDGIWKLEGSEIQ